MRYMRKNFTRFAEFIVQCVGEEGDGSVFLLYVIPNAVNTCLQTSTNAAAT